MMRDVNMACSIHEHEYDFQFAKHELFTGLGARTRAIALATFPFDRCERRSRMLTMTQRSAPLESSPLVARQLLVEPSVLAWVAAVIHERFGGSEGKLERIH